MYLWNTAIPYRDGNLEAGIVIHELSHVLSIHFDWWPRELRMSWMGVKVAEWARVGEVNKTVYKKDTHSDFVL